MKGFVRFFSLFAALIAFSSCATYYYELGDSARLRGDHVSAIAYFTRGMEQDPIDYPRYAAWPVLWYIGWEYLRIGEPEKARACFEKLVEQFSKEIDGRDISHYDPVIDGLDISHTYVPAEAFNTWEKGVIATSQNWRSDRSIFLSSYELSPQRKERCELAIKYYTEAIRLAPGYAAAYWRRAHTYYGMRNYDRAKEDYYNALIHLIAGNNKYLLSGGVVYDIYERVFLLCVLTDDYAAEQKFYALLESIESEELKYHGVEAAKKVALGVEAAKKRALEWADEIAAEKAASQPAASAAMPQSRPAAPAPAAGTAAAPAPSASQPAASAPAVVDLTGRTSAEYTLEIGKTYRFNAGGGEDKNCVINIPQNYRAVIITTAGNFDTNFINPGNVLTKAFSDDSPATLMKLMAETEPLAFMDMLSGGAEENWRIQDDISPEDRNARLVFEDVTKDKDKQLSFTITVKDRKEGAFTVQIQALR
jgi:tetratricopeptide (TPR) repeat protein